MGGASGYFSGSKRPDREHMNLDPCPYMRSASFMFLSGFISQTFFPHVLSIVVGLAPPIFIDDIGERNTTDWPKPAHWVADRQQGIGMHAGRQAERGLRFLLELQIERRQ